jgi:phosphohistidine phosphatase
MKSIYFIRHAKAGWSIPNTSDFERSISKKGRRDINTMGSYLALRGVKPDLILSSCALRAQQTTDLLAEKIAFEGERYYLQELYLTSSEAIGEIVSIQDDDIDTMFIVGHNPYLHELANSLIDEHISKFPSLGIVAINFDTESWSSIGETRGEIDFFIFPKQFKYYMPRQIRSFLTEPQAES